MRAEIRPTVSVVGRRSLGSPAHWHRENATARPGVTDAAPADPGREAAGRSASSLEQSQIGAEGTHQLAMFAVRR